MSYLKEPVGEFHTAWKQLLKVPEPKPELQTGAFHEKGLPKTTLSFVGGVGCDFQMWDNLGGRFPFSIHSAEAADSFADFFRAVADAMRSRRS